MDRRSFIAACGSLAVAPNLPKEGDPWDIFVNNLGSVDDLDITEFPPDLHFGLTEFIATGAPGLAVGQSMKMEADGFQQFGTIADLAPMGSKGGMRVWVRWERVEFSKDPATWESFEFNVESPVPRSRFPHQDRRSQLRT
jgi:hypothetical protein